MRIYIHSRTFGLAQKFLQIVQVVSADQDARILPCSDVHFRQFRMTVSGGIGLIQQSHHLYPVLSGFKHQCHQFVCTHRLHGDTCQSRLHKGMDSIFRKAQTHGMLVVGSHSLQSVHQQFLQRTQIFVRFSQYADRS